MLGSKNLSRFWLLAPWMMILNLFIAFWVLLVFMFRSRTIVLCCWWGWTIILGEFGEDFNSCSTEWIVDICTLLYRCRLRHLVERLFASELSDSGLKYVHCMGVYTWAFSLRFQYSWTVEFDINGETFEVEWVGSGFLFQLRMWYVVLTVENVFLLSHHSTCFGRGLSMVFDDFEEDRN